LNTIRYGCHERIEYDHARRTTDSRNRVMYSRNVARNATYGISYVYRYDMWAHAHAFVGLHASYNTLTLGVGLLEIIFFAFPAISNYFENRFTPQGIGRIFDYRKVENWLFRSWGKNFHTHARARGRTHIHTPKGVKTTTL